MHWKCISSWAWEVFTLHSVCVLILVAKATDVNNKHQSHKHAVYACCWLRNVLGGGGKGRVCLL